MLIGRWDACQSDREAGLNSLIKLTTVRNKPREALSANPLEGHCVLPSWKIARSPQCLTDIIWIPCQTDAQPTATQSARITPHSAMPSLIRPADEREASAIMTTSCWATAICRLVKLATLPQFGVKAAW